MGVCETFSCPIFIVIIVLVQVKNSLNRFFLFQGVGGGNIGDLKRIGRPVKAAAASQPAEPDASGKWRDHDAKKDDSLKTKDGDNRPDVVTSHESDHNADSGLEPVVDTSDDDFETVEDASPRRCASLPDINSHEEPHILIWEPSADNNVTEPVEEPIVQTRVVREVSIDPAVNNLKPGEEIDLEMPGTTGSGAAVATVGLTLTINKPTPIPLAESQVLTISVDNSIG